MSLRTFIVPLTVSFLLAFSVIGCEYFGYRAMEKFGYHKRDILVNRVEGARDSQEEAKEQFESALDQFTTVLNIEGGELQEKYDKLKKALDESEAKADAVRDRIRSVEDVADDLFDEWEKELEDYSDESLRRVSAQKLKRTQQRYTELISAMRRAEAKMEPVLTPFRDQVLFLKHNLNAEAVAKLQGTLASIETDVAALIQEMETSIAEADEFIKEMSTEEGDSQ